MKELTNCSILCIILSLKPPEQQQVHVKDTCYNTENRDKMKRAQIVMQVLYEIVFIDPIKGGLISNHRIKNG